MSVLASRICLIILLAGAAAEIEARGLQTMDVGVQAGIAGGGTPPVVEYMWILPDEDGLTPGTQIWPKASVERTDLYACIVVSDPNGRDNVASVYVDVYHPDCAPECGSFKYQKHGVKLDIVSQRSEIEACKQAALSAGLITQAEFNDIDYNVFGQFRYHMYKVDLKNNFCQPAGLYKVAAYAVDQQGAISPWKGAFFTWIESVILQIDFYNGLNFGVLAPNVHQWVHGDEDMSTPGAPTVKNEGNVPIAISLNASTMTGSAHHNVIVDFDSQFRYEYLTFQAGDKVTFSKSLELCRTRKIDFSVMAPAGTPGDVYGGGITIYAAKGAYENTCTQASTTTSSTSTTSSTTSSGSGSGSTSSLAGSSTSTSSTSSTEPVSSSTTLSGSSTTTSTIPASTTSSTEPSSQTTSSTCPASSSTAPVSSTTSICPSSTSSTGPSTPASTSSTTTTLEGECSSTTSSTVSTEPASSTTTSSTVLASTTSSTAQTTSTTIIAAAEFLSDAWVLAALMTAPALAYLAVNRKR